MKTYHQLLKSAIHAPLRLCAFAPLRLCEIKYNFIWNLEFDLLIVYQ
jgi:hypothetical protein